MPQHPPLVRASILRGFEDFLGKRGIASFPLLQEAGLETSCRGDYDRELPFVRVAQLMERAAVACEDTNFGIKLAKAYPVGGMGLFAFLFMNSRTIEDALQTIVRYVPLLRIPFKFSFEGDGAETSGQWSLQWRPIDGMSPDHKQIYSFGAALLMLRLRSLLPDGWQPLRVDLQSAAPNDPTEHESVFGPRIVYSAANNAVYVDAETLAHPVPQATPELRAVLERYGETEIAGLLAPDDTLIEATRSSILRLMGERRITLEDVAADLQYTPRTLQSRLAATATTFEEVLNEARKARAAQLLMNAPPLPLTEIAYRLGFSELSAFTRASQRWFNRSPTAQRRLLKAKALSAADKT